MTSSRCALPLAPPPLFASQGLDDIGLTMQKMDKIRTFEAKRMVETPWLDGATTRVPNAFPVKDMPLVAPPKTPSMEDWKAEAKTMAAAA